MRALLRKLVSRFHRGRLDGELEEEIRAHLEMATEENIRRGMSPRDAQLAARRSFGGIEPMKERYRDLSPTRLLEVMLRDARIGARSLRRSPILSLSLLFILGTGIGGSVTIFSALETVLLRPLPYADAERLAILETRLIAQDLTDGSSIPNVEDWRSMSRSLEDITYYRRTHRSQATVEGDTPRRVQEGLVGPGFFELLGTPPLLGRTFSLQEMDLGEPVVVLGEELWRRRFGRALTLSGQTLTIDGEAHDVIGVMPRTFQLPTRDTEMWRPLSVSPRWEQLRTARGADGVQVIGRLHEGVEIAQARVELNAIAARLRLSYPENENKGVSVVPMTEYLFQGRTRAGLWFLLAAALVLLLQACGNAAGLLLSRGTRRSREMAIRTALGASRATLFRQVLAEGLVVGLGAMAVGLLVTRISIPLLLRFGPSGLPRFEQLSLSPLGLSVAVVCGLGTVMLFGFLPALRASGTEPVLALKSGGALDPSSSARQSLEDLLAAGQIATATLLLVAATLLVASFREAHQVDPGYAAQSMAIVRVDLPARNYPDDQASLRFHRLAAERIGALPGVEAVGAIGQFFFASNPDLRISIEGGVFEWPDGQVPPINGNDVTPGYFEALKIPLLSGRSFEDRDLFPPGRHAAFIVNEALARRFWPGQDTIGRRFQIGTLPFDPTRPSATVVGVVADMQREGLDVEALPALFAPDVGRQMDICVRTSLSATEMIPALRLVLKDLDESLPFSITTAGTVLSDRLSERRFLATLVGIFSVSALLLSATGMYSLLACYVGSRAREIGLRRALGASQADVMLSVLSRSSRVVVPGIVVGLLAAAALSRLVAGLLFGVSELHAPAYLGVAALLAVVALIACWVPASQAARIDPMQALRLE